MEQQNVFVNLNDSGSYEVFISQSGNEIPILYDDNHLLIVVKPSGVLSQSDGSDSTDMLAILKEYIKIKYSKPGDVFLGLVHRLDRPVGGIMVFAKTSKGASRISEQIREKKVTKKYFAVVHGTPREETGKLISKLLKNSSNIVSEDEEGKEAVLYYSLKKTNTQRNVSLLDIKLETGRSHQIRKQCSDIGNPILGDKKYGDLNESYSGDIALFSYSFSFKHPTKDLIMNVEAVPNLKQAWALFDIEWYN